MAYMGRVRPKGLLSNVRLQVYERVVILLVEVYYSKEPQSLTAFDLFPLFRAVLIQSEAS